MQKVILIIFSFTIIFALGYLAGSFSKEFNLNQCYSSILLNIQKDIDYAVKSKNISDLLKIQKKLESLPIRGYESHCKEINKIYISNKGNKNQ